jgi:topoisomerase-4 subunit A
MKELRDWRGKRADAGRIAPKGFPKDNKFAALVTKSGKGDDKAES